MQKKQEGREYTRNLVRIRDKWTCQDCGDKRTREWATKHNKRCHDVHHLNGLCGKKSRGYDRVADMDGLITLCHKCHFRRHDWRGNEKVVFEDKPATIKQMQELRDTGLSLDVIGKKFNVSASRVTDMLSPTYGKTRVKIEQKDWRDIKRLRGKGKTLQAIASVYGVRYQRIGVILKQMQ